MHRLLRCQAGTSVACRFFGLGTAVFLLMARFSEPMVHAWQHKAAEFPITPW